MLNKLFLNKVFIDSKNEESSQAVARFVFLTVFSLYLIVIWFFTDSKPVNNWIFLAIVMGAMYSLFHYMWIKRSPSSNHYRKLIAIVVDVTLVSVAMYYLEWSGLFLFSVYLWIIVGNGMRFGMSYLFRAMFLTLFEFTVLLFISPFWVNNHEVAYGLIGIIILLPLFFLVMIHRLQNINSELKSRLELQKQQEVLLIQQSRQAAMGEMISNIAHQWRQPLNALSLLLQNIENAYELDVLDEAFIKKSIAKGEKLTDTMSSTIDNFRNFFKPNKQKEIFSIKKAIESSLEIVDASFKNANIEVIMNFEEGDQVYGYENEFSQVVLNIVTNAKDALVENRAEGRLISIRTYEKDGSVVVDFEDNGGGIPENMINKIFDPYFTTKEDGKGTGIGLYMSSLIVKGHMGGKIRAYNVENGVVFKVEFPCKQDEVLKEVSFSNDN